MELYHAALCEDERGSLEFIRTHLAAELERCRFPAAFDSYTSSVELLKAVEQGAKYDLLFLDIDMPRLDGISLCRKFREAQIDALVVFISNKEELVFQTFEVRPFRFMRKNHFLEELPTLARDIRREFLNRSEEVLPIQENSSNKVYSFHAGQILYVEALLKECRFVLPNSEQRVHCQLGALEKQLAEHGFIRCHRSYLVNYRWIYLIEKEDILLEDRRQIPLSRSRAAEVRRLFLQYLGGGGQQ